MVGCMNNLVTQSGLMGRPTFTLLVGNIGCGKSTKAKTFALEGDCVVDADYTRFMLGAGNYVFDLRLEPWIKLTVQGMVKELLARGFNVVLDSTNVTEKGRKEWIKCVSTIDCLKVCYVLPRYSRHKAVGFRMKHDPRGYTRKQWEDIYDKFDHRYEVPKRLEGWDYIRGLDA